MNFRMLSDLIMLQSKVEAKDTTIAELTNEVKELGYYERDLHEILDEKNKDIASLHRQLARSRVMRAHELREILDEKNKDIASLHRQLREVKEKLSKLISYKAWNIAEDLEINIELSEGYDDGKEKQSNNS